MSSAAPLSNDAMKGALSQISSLHKVLEDEPLGEQRDLRLLAVAVLAALARSCWRRISLDCLAGYPRLNFHASTMAFTSNSLFHS
jgi:hypothetical protein